MYRDLLQYRFICIRNTSKLDALHPITPEQNLFIFFCRPTKADLGYSQDANHTFPSKTEIANDYKSINLKHQKFIFQILESRFLFQGWLNLSRFGSFGRRLMGVLIENLLSESDSCCDAQHSLAGGCFFLLSTFVFSLHFSSSILYTVSLVELDSTPGIPQNFEFGRSIKIHPYIVSTRLPLQ